MLVVWKNQMQMKKGGCNVVQRVKTLLVRKNNNAAAVYQTEEFHMIWRAGSSRLFLFYLFHLFTFSSLKTSYIASVDRLHN